MTKQGLLDALEDQDIDLIYQEAQRLRTVIEWAAHSIVDSREDVKYLLELLDAARWP